MSVLFWCEYKYLLNGVKRLQPATIPVIGWMQGLGLIRKLILIDYRRLYLCAQRAAL
jgi:hypothetical protein